MDYDDTLTPEISIELMSNTETLRTSSVSANGSKENISLTASRSFVNMPEPDLELLAVLLKIQN